MEIKSFYLSRPLDISQFSTVVNQICAKIRRIAKDADAIAFRGTSGLLVGMSVCAKLKKHPIVVRKSTEGSHSSFLVEGAVSANKIVIVDDLCETGSTIRAIMDSIQKDRSVWDGEFECLAAVMYNWDFERSEIIAWDEKNISVHGTRK